MLAIVAGGVLSAPFAVGTANAATITFTVVGPTAGTTAGSATTAAIAATRAADPARQISVTPPTLPLASLPLAMSLVGSSAYFASPGTGYTLSNNNQTAICTSVANCANAIFVDDNVAEVAPLGGSDASGDIGVGTLEFNGSNFTVSAQECPTTDIDTTANCVTQGQVGTAIPVVVHYAAGQSGATDTDGAFRQLVVTVYGPTGGGQPVIVTANPATPNTVTCTTDANGNCNLVVVDTNPLDTDSASVTGHKGHDTLAAAISNTSAVPYPGIDNAGAIAGVATAGPQGALNITSGSVALTRLDLVSAQLIGPSAQDSNAKNAEPGDAVQLIYTAYGSCTPTTFVTCTGQTLAGLSIPLTIDHGFFTPNCEASQSDDPSKLLLNTYGNCSFSTAPAAGGLVGSLANFGTTKTVVTNTAGQFVVTIGIGRDTAFDTTGAVVAHVTSGTVGTTIPGDTRPTTAGSCTTTGADNVVSPTATKATLAGVVPPAVGVPGDYGDCSVGVQWVTNEQPLNGGTAKITVLPALVPPENDPVDTENNYGAPNVTDTGTRNVPDTARVVFEIDSTDQFGNPVSYTAGTAPVRLTKMGPGFVYNCAGSSAIDACTGAVKNGLSGVAQPDGTFTETGSLAGTYGNLPTTASPTGPQIRYQADVRTNDGSAANDGFSTGVPGAIDGTQTDVVSWAAPRVTFGALTAGVWSYNASTASPATDTLTLNFYNQLAQPVALTVAPGDTIAKSTTVTVTATEIDQFANPMAGQSVAFTRSGGIASSCTPKLTEPTDNSGAARYLITCSSAGKVTVSVVVSTPTGTQLAAGTAALTFTSGSVVPSVSSVSPSSGSSDGGTSVTITGTGFTGTTAVSFGGVAATNVVVNSATSITATSPAHAVGAVNVRVTTAAGQSAVVTPADQFTYVAFPMVSGVSPVSGPPAGGTSVTITGSGFTGATVVTFGGVSATNVVVNSDTSVTATSPAHAAATTNVRVTTPVGQSAVVTPDDQFTYSSAPVLPVVSVVSPASGPLAGGSGVTVTGSGFTAASSVAFGGVAAESVSFVSSSELDVTSPAHAAGMTNVRVTTKAGQSAVVTADQFTYAPAPKITKLSPKSGPAAGATSVTITGTGFTPDATVSFGAANAATSVTYVSSTELIAVSPPHAVTSNGVNVTVTTGSGTSAVVTADQYKYT